MTSMGPPRARLRRAAERGVRDIKHENFARVLLRRLVFCESADDALLAHPGPDREAKFVRH